MGFASTQFMKPRRRVNFDDVMSFHTILFSFKITQNSTLTNKLNISV